MYILVFYCLLNGLYNYFEKGSSNQINKISGALKFGIFKNLFSAFFACLMVIVSGCNFNYSIPLLGCALAFGFLIAIDLTNYLFLAKTGTIALRRACRRIACARVKPFVLASKRYSPVSISVSSARVNRA